MADAAVSFADLLGRDRPVIIDGGLATQLEAQGCDLDSALWSAAILLEDPQAIADAHRAYLEAGAEIIASCSYQASRPGFAALGIDAATADQLLSASVELALEARDEYVMEYPERRQDALVAASVGPYGAMLHDGSEYSGNYGVSSAQLTDFHRQRLELFDGSGADVLACETIPCYREAAVLSELLCEARTPAWLSFSCRNDREISDGTPIERAVGLFDDHPRVLAVGVNCTRPDYISGLIQRVVPAIPGKAIIVYPNSGETYAVDDNSWSGTSAAATLAEAAPAWVAAGARVVGGCCRTGPSQIRATRQRLHPGWQTG
jgi:homocysteine S-methyltransferase